MDVLNAVLKVVGWLVVCAVAFYVVSQVTDRALENKANRHLQLARYLCRTALIMIMVMVTVLSLDANLTSIAGLGIAASFMLQDAAKNFFAGLRHITRSGAFRGQVIEINNNARLYGKIVKIDASAITIRTPNHNNVTVANGDIFSIINYTSEHTTRTDTKMFLDGSPTLRQWEVAEAVMLDELEKVALETAEILHPDEVEDFAAEKRIRGMHPEVVRPQVIDDAILGGGEQYILRVFAVDPMLRPEVQAIVRNRVRKRLQSEGISVGLSDNISLNQQYAHTANRIVSENGNAQPASRSMRVEDVAEMDEV